jgi:hypothetical protein
MVQYVCRSDMIEVGKRHAKFSYHSQARTSSKFIERFGVITLLTSTTAMISSRTLLLFATVCTSSVLTGPFNWYLHRCEL